MAAGCMKEMEKPMKEMSKPKTMPMMDKPKGGKKSGK